MNEVINATIEQYKDYVSFWEMYINMLQEKFLGSWRVLHIDGFEENLGGW